MRKGAFFVDWSVLPELIISIVQLFVVLAGLVGVFILIRWYVKKQVADKANYMAREKWRQEQDIQRQQTSVDWVCELCGGVNHNREVCENCGSSTRVAR